MILAESAAEALVAVFTAAIVIFAFGTALAQAIANRRQIEGQLKQKRRDEEKRLQETGTRAAQKVWRGACAVC